MRSSYIAFAFVLQRMDKGFSQPKMKGICRRAHWIVSSITGCRLPLRRSGSPPTACETWTDWPAANNESLCRSCGLFSSSCTSHTHNKGCMQCVRAVCACTPLNCHGELFGWAPSFPRTTTTRTNSAALCRSFALPWKRPSWEECEETAMWDSPCWSLHWWSRHKVKNEKEWTKRPILKDSAGPALFVLRCNH